MKFDAYIQKVRILLHNLLDVRHHIMAKMFIAFTAATLSIVFVLTGLWYKTSIDMSYRSTVSSLENSLSVANQQVDRAVQDVMRLHGSLLYGSNNISYVVRDDLTAPALNWFEDYKKVLELLKTMVTNLNRTLSGTGFFKRNGESCFAGSVTVQGSPFQTDWFQAVEAANGGDVIFLTSKSFPQDVRQMPYSISIARTVLSMGEYKAVLVSDINDSVVKDVFSSIHMDNGFILVFDERGRCIFDSAPDAYANDKAEAPRFIKAHALPAYTNNFLYVSNTSAVTNWTAVAAVPMSYVWGNMKQIRFQFVMLLVVSLLVIAAISIVLSRGITHGLQTLNKNMKRVSTGALTGMKALPAQDEVGELSRVFVSMVQQIQQLLEDIRQRENQKRKMEIQVLRAQVSPHFLYNTLNTIIYLSAMQNAENIRTLTASLVDLLQAAVNLDDTLVTVEDELRYVQSYLNIQQYRYAQSIAIEQQIDENVRPCKVARMVLQPIVENAVIHGLSEIQRPRHIRIRVWQESRELIFSVTDNGVGMSQEQISQVLAQEYNASKMRFSGIGLRNVDERIKLQFGQEYGLHIYSQPGFFTTVEIHMPVIKGEGEDA